MNFYLLFPSTEIVNRIRKRCFMHSRGLPVIWLNGGNQSLERKLKEFRRPSDRPQNTSCHNYRTLRILYSIFHCYKVYLIKYW